MDWLTFSAEVIKALAWPAAVLIILLVLRRPLSDLLPLLQRLRYKDLELDFGKRIQELAVDVNKALPAALGAGNAAKRLRDRLAQIAPLSPRAVVLESWLELEEAAIDASKRHDLHLTSREMKAPILLGQALEAAGILDEHKQEIFYRLRNIRNAATHASDFALNPASAMAYADAAIRLAEYLRETQARTPESHQPVPERSVPAHSQQPSRTKPQSTSPRRKRRSGA